MYSYFQLYYYDTKIVEKKKREMLVHYFVPDDLGPYQQEQQSYYIDKKDILKPIKRLEVKRIGCRRSTFLFPDL